jgi:hypothetical protein
MEIPDRDPTAFFDALAELRSKKEIGANSLRVVLRASGCEETFQAKINERGIGDIVSLQPRISYEEALNEMKSADGLLLFQGPACNLQIPAKAYEYLAVRKPVFGLVDPHGETCRLLREAGITTLATMNSKQEIARALREFLAFLRRGDIELPSSAMIARFSRRSRTAELAELFNAINGA